MDKELLETFENTAQQDYVITIELPEFTALCPISGNPDFATIAIAYVPDQLCVELKSIKIFIQSFRNDGVFHEAVTNDIYTILADMLKPKYLRVVGDFNRRGNVKTVVRVEKWLAEFVDVDIPEYYSKEI